MTFWDTEIASIKNEVGITSNDDLVHRLEMLRERIETHHDIYDVSQEILSFRCELCNTFSDILKGHSHFVQGTQRNKMEQMEIGNESNVNLITTQERMDIVHEQDKQLEEIFDGVVGLEKVGKDLGEEATKQNHIIIDLDKNIDSGTNALLDTNLKTEALAADSNNCPLYLTIGLLFVILCIIFFMGFGTF